MSVKSKFYFKHILDMIWIESLLCIDSKIIKLSEKLVKLWQFKTLRHKKIAVQVLRHYFERSTAVI